MVLLAQKKAQTVSVFAIVCQSVAVNRRERNNCTTAVKRKCGMWQTDFRMY